ncbi:unnamed protein product [Macrosiphum euphorbiae]|uniref:Uncharacterized protein n=1 Tax=Macrosiphum euphorbiae TaxID=13131 RepID=A0AAV0XQR8_9HEMI|nr:unnamed protein product [Macrosiphum euphorbiae]
MQYGISQSDYIYTNQVKLYATDYIVQKWMNKVKKDEGYNSERSMTFSPPPPCTMTFSPPPPSFSSLYEQENLSSVSPLSPSAQESYLENNQEGFSENDGPFGPQYN